MRTRARLLSGAMCLLVLATVGAILFIGFLPAYAQAHGDEERTVSTPASRAPYVPLQAQPVNVSITQINPSKFPIIELYVLATDQDGNTIAGLSASNFLATEQSNLESQPTTETISVASVTITGNITVALAIDRSGSMSGSKIADAKTAANAFVDNLALLDRAAVISFSSSVTINQVFTSDKTALHNAVNSLSAGGNTAVYDAIHKSVEELTSEIGVKAVIIFTDGQSNSDSHSVQEAIDLAKDRGIPVYTIGLGAGVNESVLQTIANETGGYYVFAPTAADLQQIYNDIAQAIRDQYLVTYSTHNPNYDGTTRTVEVTATVGANSDSDTATYTVTEPPEISLTQDTLNLMAQAQYAGQTLTIGAIITDDVSVTQAKLFYRTSGSGDIYKEVLMTSSSDLYTADIPGSDIATPGVDFYITASDGTLTSSSPQNNPATYPHQISILPNEAPVIDHTPVTTATVGTNVVISANVTDTTDYVDSVKLFYRTTGYVLYDSTDMVSSSDTYVETIAGSKVTLAGIDYYIVASDNHSVRTYDGIDVAPHHIDVTSGPINHPPDTKIETADIDSSNGTAKFTWSGSDDTTPATELTYSYRLVRPGPAYATWSSWSSGKTKKYTDLSPGDYKFQVRAKDADGAIDPSPASKEFAVELKPLHCDIQLRKAGVGTALESVDVNATFEIYAGDSTGSPVEVRFASDDSQDGTQAGEWTRWYDWGVSSGEWNASRKSMRWEFSTAGKKEVWLQLKNQAGGTSECHAWIDAGRVYRISVVFVKPGSTSRIPDYASYEAIAERVTSYFRENSYGQVLMQLHFNANPEGRWISLDQEDRLYVDSKKTYQYNVIASDVAKSASGHWYSDPQVDGTLVVYGGTKGRPVAPGRYAIVHESTPMGTWAHELCHVLGVLQFADEDDFSWHWATPDLYLERSEGRFGNVGAWDLMGSGNWLGSPAGTNPCYISSYTREFLGWLEYGDTLSYPTSISRGIPSLGSSSLGDSVFRYTFSSHESIILETRTNSEEYDPDGGHYWDSSAPIKTGTGAVIVYYVDMLNRATGETIDDHSGYGELTKRIVSVEYVMSPGNSEKLYSSLFFGDSITELSADDVRTEGDHYSIEVQIQPRDPSFLEQLYFGLILKPMALLQGWYGKLFPEPSDGPIPWPDLDLHLFGSGGEHIGINYSTGEYEIEIPGAIVSGSSCGGYEWIFIPSSTKDVRFVVSSKPTAEVIEAFPEILDHTSCTDSYIVQGFVLDPSGDVYRSNRIEGDIEPGVNKEIEYAVLETGDGRFEIRIGNLPPTLSIASPSAEQVVTGTACMIQWQAEDPDHPADSLSIDLFYSIDGGNNWTAICSNETNDGAYDWDISGLDGGEYWLKIVVTDPDGGTAEATTGPFTVSVFEGSIIAAPNPVSGEGVAFFYVLPEGTTAAKLMIFNVTGRRLFETPLDVDSTRFPSAGTWNPVDQDGVELANGPYVYVLIADGKAIGQGKMVIQR